MALIFFNSNWLNRRNKFTSRSFDQSRWNETTVSNDKSPMSKAGHIRSAQKHTIKQTKGDTHSPRQRQINSKIESHTDTQTQPHI